jgi:branched-chain amino acid transport system ATP-binding protein
MSLLEIDKLCVWYGPVFALKDATLSVGSGEAVALIGANGAGKSTLFKSIVGFLRPKSGALRFLDRDVTGFRTEQRIRLGLGYSPEGRRVFPGLTVRENLEVAVFAGKAERARRVDRAFSLFPQLATRQGALGWQLSGGQQQMLAIGRALMARPRLLMLDEPSMGIAPILVQRIYETIAEINRAGVAILLVEQNANYALDIARRGYVLETGSVALLGESDQLRDDPEVQRAYLGT